MEGEGREEGGRGEEGERDERMVGGRETTYQYQTNVTFL